MTPVVSDTQLTMHDQFIMVSCLLQPTSIHIFEPDATLAGRLTVLSRRDRWSLMRASASKVSTSWLVKERNTAISKPLQAFELKDTCCRTSLRSEKRLRHARHCSDVTYPRMVFCNRAISSHDLTSLLTRKSPHHIHNKYANLRTGQLVHEPMPPHEAH